MNIFRATESISRSQSFNLLHEINQISSVPLAPSTLRDDQGKSNYKSN